MGIATSRMSLMQKNKMLKQELNHITSSLEEAGTAIPSSVEEQEEEDEEDDDDEEMPEDYIKSEAQMGRARQSVSAEAYGTWNQKKAFTPPKNPKTDEQKDRLKDTLLKSFM